MWGASLLILIITVTLTGCWLFGCCGVLWKMTKCGSVTVGVSCIFLFGTMVCMTMSLTIWIFVANAFGA